MAIKSVEEILNSIKGIIGERTDDDAMSILEDVQDTFASIETAKNDTTDWKKKYDELDDSWRKKYRDRFFNHPAEDEETDDEETGEPAPLTYDSLFKIKE